MQNMANFLNVHDFVNAMVSFFFSLAIQLLGWLEEKLPTCGKLPSPEVTTIIGPLYSTLEDRSGDVRKKAQVVLPLFMAHVSYDTMLKHAGKLKVSKRKG